MAHELKLMLLLSDQVEEASRRDKEALEVSKEVEEGRKRVGVELARLLRGDDVESVREGEGEGETGGSGTGEAEAEGKGDDGDDGMEVDKPETTVEREAEELQKPETNTTPKDDRMGAVDEEDKDEDEDEGFEQVA